jgi:hypothetical protein
MLLALLLLSPVVLSPVVACGGSQGGETDSGREKKAKKKKHREHPPDKDAVSEKGKSWGGWRWKGKRDDCFYVVDNKCFDTKKQACMAAKCGGKACTVKKGAPSKVSCEK